MKLSDERIIELGKRFYPRLRKGIVVNKNGSQILFLPFKSPRTHYSAIGMQHLIQQHVMEEKIKELGGIIERHSRTTSSLYFTVDGKRCRISDHPHNSGKTYFIDIVIDFTNPASPIHQSI